MTLHAPSINTTCTIGLLRNNKCKPKIFAPTVETPAELLLLWWTASLDANSVHSHRRPKVWVRGTNRITEPLQETAVWIPVWRKCLFSLENRRPGATVLSLVDADHTTLRERRDRRCASVFCCPVQIVFRVLGKWTRTRTLTSLRNQHALGSVD